MKYPADFRTHEEYLEWRTTGKMPLPHAAINYLKAEPIRENHIIFKAKLDYMHTSLYNLSSHWAYLTKNDLRSIVPFIDRREKNKPCYITFGESFYEVVDIQPNENGILELVLQNVGLWNLN